MPDIVEITAYRFEELSDEAREHARAWYRERALDDDWYEAVYEDFETICAILGLRLTTSPVRLMGGGTRSRSHIYFSGFGSQGDGACFEGGYVHARQASTQMRRHAPKDVELHRIADSLQAVQRRNFYQLCATVSHRGHYHHEHSMTITVERKSATGQPVTGSADDTVREALRDLARWLYRQLESEYVYRMSDEIVGNDIIANDYVFMIDGRQFG